MKALFAVALAALLIADAQAASPDSWTWCKSYKLAVGQGPLDVCGPDPQAILVPYCATDWAAVLGIGPLTPKPPFITDDGGYRFNVPCADSSGTTFSFLTEQAHRQYHCPVPDNQWHDAAVMWENGQVQANLIGHCPDNDCPRRRQDALTWCNYAQTAGNLACTVGGAVYRTPILLAACLAWVDAAHTRCQNNAPVCN